ncbi:hypothetical protein ASG89_01135 [Paenibacillus sp. Soil766]|uniref:hypothetical protein n=1 Tax=Paenibacillus sp. Soil766 TaxID=1736404 RepID=UPI00070E92D6|nr:hypothetical protein [Paenibacillus sp. Soil766]KRF10172.1 hypothetical protein ASG89_01135 [Paenibacillus sp. Soil766]
MKKTILVLVAVFAIIGWVSYQYSYNSVVDAFTSDSAKETTENSASKLMNTKQKYYFSLVNTSKKSVSLKKIELQDYKGIKIGDLTIDGQPFTVQSIPSHRVYTSADSWTTNNQRIIVDYDVEIQEPVIQNPRSILITYTYLGLEHKQTIKINVLR